VYFDFLLVYANFLDERREEQFALLHVTFRQCSAQVIGEVNRPGFSGGFIT
jgi:hypothetical protein